MKVKVTVSGFRDLEKSFGGIEKAVTRKSIARRALKQGAWPFVDTFKRFAPVDEGDYRENIDVGTRLSKRQRKQHKKLDPVEVFAGATNEVPQAVQQEFGNVNHPAQPAARPAWDSQQHNMLAAIQNELEDEVAKAAKRQAKRKARKRK